MTDTNFNDANIVYISQFGSYDTEEWIEGVSDIDIGVVVKSLNNIEPYLEDNIKMCFQKEYNYDIVNVTFVELDYDSKLCRNIICGKTLYTTINEKDAKRECLYIENITGFQRRYYEISKLEQLRNEVNNLW